MIIDFALIVLGIALLVWSADRFTDGAAAVATNFGVSPLIVGLTIIAIGSSAPEILVSITATLDAKPELAIGNALGSNIANIAFVVGVTAIVSPLKIESKILRREFPVLFLVTVVAGALLFDLKLELLDGIILLSGLIAYIGWLIHTAHVSAKAEPDLMIEELIEELPETMSTGKAAIYIISGAILLGISSKILVHSATNIALYFGVSEIVVGLTVVAIGTSLPELAASIAGVLKDEHEMAIGNVIGSNIFNLLAVLGVPGLIMTVNIEQVVLTRDFSLVLGLSIALFVMAYGIAKPGNISRIEGCILFTVYLGYLSYLIYSEASKLDKVNAVTMTQYSSTTQLKIHQLDRNTYA